MNQDKLEFYYQSKNIHSIQEKTASDKQQELEEKIAGNMRAVLSNFAAKHPKATESAITGGILGAGSELVMPANKDMYGNPSTNLGEIGKRALLGATLGGIGGELKTQVRSHVIPKIAQEDFDKIAGKLDALKSFGKRNAFTLGQGAVTGGAAAWGGYLPKKDVTGKKIDQKTRVNNAVVSGLMGTAAGAFLGRGNDKSLNKLKNAIKANNITNQNRHNNTLRKGISNFLEHSPVLPKDVAMPSNVKKVPSRVVKPLQLPANASSGTPKKKSLFGKLFSKEAGFIGRAGELLAGGAKMPVNFTTGTKVVRPGNVNPFSKTYPSSLAANEAVRSWGARGAAGLVGAGLLEAKNMNKKAGLIDGGKALLSGKTGRSAVGGALSRGAAAIAPSSLLQGAGSLMAKSPRVGGAVIGGAAGLAGNALSGEDHALGSTLAGAAMGGLAGKKLLANNATRNPLFGKSFGTGVRNELKAGINAKQNLANSLKVPTKVNMSATEQAAASLKAPTPMSPQMAPRNAPINTNKVEPYAVNTKGPVAKLPTQQSEQLINEKAKSNMNQQVSQAYKPTRSSVPMPSNVAMGSRPQHVMNLRS